MAIFFADLFADLSGARDRSKVSHFKLYPVAKVGLKLVLIVISNLSKQNTIA
jgi:hypothetical protein